MPIKNPYLDKYKKYTNPYIDEYKKKYIEPEPEPLPQQVVPQKKNTNIGKSALNVGLRFGEGAIEVGDFLVDAALQLSTSKYNPYYWFNPDKLESHQNIGRELIVDTNLENTKKALGYTDELQQRLDQDAAFGSKSFEGQIVKGIGTEATKAVLTAGLAGGNMANAYKLAPLVSGVQGYGTGVSDAYSSGVTDRRTANIAGIATAAVDAITEKLVPGSPGFRSTKEGVKTTLKALKTYGINAGGEAVEEMLASILHPIVNEYIYTGNKNDNVVEKFKSGVGKIDLKQVLLDGISGMLIAGVLDAPQLGSNLKEVTQSKKQAQVASNLINADTSKMSNKEKAQRNAMIGDIKSNLNANNYDADKLISKAKKLPNKKASPGQSAIEKVVKPQSQSTLDNLEKDIKTTKQDSINNLNTRMTELKNEINEYSEKLKEANKFHNDEDIGIYTHEINKLQKEYNKEEAAFKTTQDELIKIKQQEAIDAEEVIAVDTFKKTKAYKLMDEVSSKNGVKLNIISKDIQGDVQQGMFDRNAKEITVNLKSEKSVVRVFTHELLHPLEKTKAYSKIKSYMETALGKEGQAHLQAQIEKAYKTNDLELTADKLESEMVAHFVEDILLTSETDVKQLFNTDRTLFDRMHAFVNNIAVRLKGSEQEKLARKLQKLYNDALKENTTSVKELNATKDTTYKKEVKSKLPKKAVDTRVDKQAIKKEQAKILEKTVPTKVETQKKKGKELPKKEVVKVEPAKVEVKQEESKINIPVKAEVAKVPEISIAKKEVKTIKKPEVINVEMKKVLPNKPTGVITNKKGKIIDNTLIKTGQMTLDSRYEFLQKNYQRYVDEKSPAKKKVILEATQKAYNNYKKDGGTKVLVGLEKPTKVSKEVAEIQHSLIGINAAKSLTQGAKLEIAKNLKNKKVKDKFIWAMTGWNKDNIDGSWKYEISDPTLKKDINIKVGEDYKLGDMVDAKKLFKAYPQLKDYEFSIIDMEKSGLKNTYKGIYAESENGGFGVYLNKNNTPEQMNITLTHEIQHAIQQIEGFAQGSSKVFYIEGAKILGIDISDTEARDFYKRTAGEVEARNVGNRLKMNTLKRKLIRPNATRDIADSEIIKAEELRTAVNKVLPKNNQFSAENIDAKASLELTRLEEKIGKEEMKQLVNTYVDLKKYQKQKEQKTRTKSKIETNTELLEETGITKMNLKTAKNYDQIRLTTSAPVRVMQKVFGSKNGEILYQSTIKPIIQSEYDKILFANSERKDIKKLGIKPKSAESRAVQQLGEGGYYTFEKGTKLEDRTTDNGVWHPYTLKDVQKEFPNDWKKIKTAEMIIRAKYDKYFKMINEVNREFGYNEVDFRDAYFLHYVDNSPMKNIYDKIFHKNVSRLSTDIAGKEHDFHGRQPFFSSKLERRGIYTAYDAITGIDKYISAMGDTVFQTKNIQRLNILENYIRQEYNINKLDNDIENYLSRGEKSNIREHHLGTFVTWLKDYTDGLTGQRDLSDIAFDNKLGNKLNTLIVQTKAQVAKNLIGYNITTPFTNFISVTQGAAFTNKKAFAKGTLKTFRNLLAPDTLMEQSRTYMTRKGEERLSNNWYEKSTEVGMAFMKATDLMSTEMIVRSKYEEYIDKGYDHKIALDKADTFASRILGGRTKGELPVLYKSKIAGIFTQFTLEPMNQLDTLFYDTFHKDFAADNKKEFTTKSEINKYNKSMAASTLLQLLAYAFVFNEGYEKIFGRRPAFDIFGVIKKAFRLYGDEEVKPDRANEAVLESVLQQLPFVDMLAGGGRTPTGDNLPNVLNLITGKSSLGDESKKLLYLTLPGGGAQLSKTLRGLALYTNKELPGKYLPSKDGDKTKDTLKYPAKTDFISKSKNILFGAASSEEARSYYEHGWRALSLRQTKMFKQSSLDFEDFKNYLFTLDKIGKSDKVKDSNGKTITSLSKSTKYEYIDNLDISYEDRQLLRKYVDGKDFD